MTSIPDITSAVREPYSVDGILTPAAARSPAMVSVPVALRRINSNAEVEFVETLRFSRGGFRELSQKGTSVCSILSQFEHGLGRE